MGCASRERKGIEQTVFPNKQINQGAGHDAGGVDSYDGRLPMNRGTQHDPADTADYATPATTLKPYRTA